MWYVYVYTESLPRPGNVSWQRRGPGTRGTPTSTSNRLACVMIFLKKYIYVYFSCFLYELARPLAKRARVASGRRDIRVDERATTEIPLAENMRATHTQLATYLYLSTQPSLPIHLPTYLRNNITYVYYTEPTKIVHR